MVYIDNNGYLVSYEENYEMSLYHHGILGMKWGKQNGPPYPLAYGRHSVSEKRAGWKDSLANVAKATGRGVAATARATGKAVRATGRGIKATARATKKGLIRLNLYPKKLMTDQDIIDRVERLRKEDLLKHMRGKMTNEDKALMKIKAKDARREVVKNTLSQLLPAVGRDLVISQIKNRMDYKFELKKAEDRDEREWDKKVETDIYNDARDNNKSVIEAFKAAQNREEISPKVKKSEEEKNREKTVWNDIYEDARSGGMSAKDAEKAANEGDSSIAPRKKDNNQNGGKGGFNLESNVKQDIYNAAKNAGLTPTEAAKLAESGDDSSLKGQDFSSGKGGKGNGGGNGNGNGNGQINKELLQKTQNKIYDEWIRSGASPAKAAKEAAALNDDVGVWKEAREKKEKQEAANAKRKETIRKNKEAAEAKAKEEATKKLVADAKQYYIDARKDEIKQKIKDIGGIVVGDRNGKIVYRDSKGNEWERDYENAALRDYNKYVISDRPTTFGELRNKPELYGPIADQLTRLIRKR